MTSFGTEAVSGLYTTPELVMNQAVKDIRLERDAQSDLHAAIDLLYAFSAELKGLHPIAERQVKAMIFQGNIL
jgi:hypothetical protein